MLLSGMKQKHKIEKLVAAATTSLGQKGVFVRYLEVPPKYTPHDITNSKLDMAQ